MVKCCRCPCLDCECECSKECCRNMPIKRYFLPLIGALVLIWFEEFRDFVYLPLVVGSVFFIIFWNFPWIVYYTASKPLYYQDLFIDEKKIPNYSINKKIKNKFKMILDWVLIITNTLLTAALADYWLYRINTVGYIEIIGVTGGIIKIFQMVNNTISRIMLKVIKSYIKDENQRYRKEQIEIISNIIKLKRVDNGLWKILDTPSKSESDDNCVEMVELSKKSEFIIPNRGRINTI